LHRGWVKDFLRSSDPLSNKREYYPGLPGNAAEPPADLSRTSC
jgi:hypothetical protein